VLNASPKEMYEIIRCPDIAKLNEWDPEIFSSKTIEEVAPDIQITHVVYKAPFPLSYREFVALRAKTVESDGSYLSYGNSINHKTFPTTKDYVRAVSIVSGWSFRPVPGNPNQCIAKRIVQMDPKGVIPAWVVNSYKTKAGLLLVSVRNFLANRNK